MFSASLNKKMVYGLSPICLYALMYVCMYVCMYGWMDGWKDVHHASTKTGIYDLIPIRHAVA
jgi:hypothetical protein